MSTAQAAYIADELTVLVVGVWILVGIVAVAAMFGWRTKK